LGIHWGSHILFEKDPFRHASFVVWLNSRRCPAAKRKTDLIGVHWRLKSPLEFGDFFG